MKICFYEFLRRFLSVCLFVSCCCCFFSYRGFEENSDRIQINTDFRTRKVCLFLRFFFFFLNLDKNDPLFHLWLFFFINKNLNMQIEELKHCPFAEVMINLQLFCISELVVHFFDRKVFYFDLTQLVVDMLVFFWLLGAIPDQWKSWCYRWVQSWSGKASGSIPLSITLLSYFLTRCLTKHVVDIKCRCQMVMRHSWVWEKDVWCWMLSRGSWYIPYSFMLAWKLQFYKQFDCVQCTREN